MPPADTHPSAGRPRRWGLRIGLGLTLFLPVVVVIVMVCGARTERWGDLDVIVRGAGTSTVIVLHGLDGNAWASSMMSDRLLARARARYLSPEAPYPSDVPFGRAWFRWAPPTGGSPGRHPIAAEADESRRQIVLMIDRARAEGAHRVVLIGFSQGAGLALDAALEAEPRADGVLMLSGIRLPTARLDRVAGLPIFVAHGRTDPLLPFDEADTGRAHLEARGAVVTWWPFDGGHDPAAPLEAAGDYIRELLAE